MKKLIKMIAVLVIIMLASVSYADTICVNNIEIEYNSVEDLQALYKEIRERMVSDYKTVLFDADTYDATTYIVGETFPAGRYYVYPVVVSDINTDLYVELLWWNKEDMDNYFCSDYVCAEWRYTVELTDGMKIKFSWDDDQRGVCIALQKLPDTPVSLMDIFN